MSDIIDIINNRIDNNCKTFLRGFIPAVLSEATDTTPETAVYESNILPYIFDLIAKNLEAFRQSFISRFPKSPYIPLINKEENPLNLMVIYVKIAFNE